MSNQSGSIILTKALDQPRAVAVILGHLGASERVLDHYLSWYSNEKRQCSVVTGSSPFARFAANASLKPTAQAVWSNVVPLLKETPPTVPLVVHMFSNGGAFLWEEMEQLVLKNVATTTDASSNTFFPSSPSPQDYALIAQRLKDGFIFYDSCPCYCRMLWDMRNLSNSFPHPGWTAFGRGSYTLCASASLTFWCTLTLAWWKPGRFWERMQTSRTCLHNIYAYTTTDLATDATKLEELIAYRRTELDADITTYKYDDSNHCRMNNDHPEEYQEAIDTALDAATERSALNNKDNTENK